MTIEEEVDRLVPKNKKAVWDEEEEEELPSPKRKTKVVETVEVMPHVRANARHVEWFVARMFNPEDNIWVWIRRIANVLTIVSLILIIITLFMVANINIPPCPECPVLTPIINGTVLPPGVIP